MRKARRLSDSENATFEAHARHGIKRSKITKNVKRGRMGQATILFDRDRQQIIRHTTEMQKLQTLEKER